VFSHANGLAKTWVQVAELIKAQGVECTPQGVFSFFKAKRKRRYAVGMEPEDAPRQGLPPTPVSPLRARDPAFSTDPEDSLFGIDLTPRNLSLSFAPCGRIGSALSSWTRHQKGQEPIIANPSRCTSPHCTWLKISFSLCSVNLPSENA
jgi:hypothetical protein